MKKFLLSLGAAALTMSSFAATRILYQQNFETAASVEETGWTIAGGTMSFVSDEFGKYLELSLGQNNGRSAQVTWGEDIFLADGVSVLGEDGVYTLKFTFSIKQGSNNQYNGCITAFTNHAPIASQPYRTPWSPAGYWQNYLFDMSQVNGEATQYVVNGETIETKDDDGNVTRAIDYSNPTTFEAGAWYDVTLTVNTIDRESEYLIQKWFDPDWVLDGKLTVPENDVNGDPISMISQGLFLFLARYQTIIDIDNIEVSIETDYDYANAPTVALTRLGQTADEENPEQNLRMRGYTITFLEGETLHVTGTDGQEITVEYEDCDEGSYTYETTTSGVLKAWTTYGDATSEVVEVNVDCEPVVLPAATLTISAVSEGFAKIYTMTVNNADVPLRPTIFMAYEFTGEDGTTLSDKNLTSGAKVEVPGKGVLKVTTSAFGYEYNTVTVANDLEFETKKAYDFARMTEDELKAQGLPAFNLVLNTAATSGFNNWTGRKRLYYQVDGTEHENEEGNMVYDYAYPFGFIAEDNTVNVINYFVIDNASNEGDVDGTGYFEGLTIFPKTGKGNKNFGFMKHIGIFNDQTNDNNNNIVVRDLDKDDFVVVNYINNYGGNSNHPIVATDEEYFNVLAGEDAVYSVAEDGVFNEETGKYDVTHALYRVDTACTKITIFKQKGGAVEGIEAETEGDNWYYSIDGVRMAQPVAPGLYIHNGKKVIVK